MEVIDGFNGEYRFLSNFYIHEPINFEGEDYPTVEHAYQAAKTLDPALRATIAALTPAKAKSAGRNVIVRSDWEDIKLSIMLTLLRKKFRSERLAVMLLKTKSAQLIEGNYWHDNFWGACTCQSCCASGQAPGSHLGRLLMQVREELRSALVS